MEKIIFETFTDFYTKKVNQIKEQEEQETTDKKTIVVGGKVRLPNGDFGTVQSWSSLTGTYIVMNNVTGKTENVIGSQLIVVESEETENLEDAPETTETTEAPETTEVDDETKIEESHITQGSKVKLSDGRMGTVEAWQDRTQTYTVSIEGEAKTVEVIGDELEVVKSLDGIVREK
jgi:uncharacterized protein YwbE